MLTTFDADDYVLRALRAGASGFLLKDTPPQDIIGAVRQVADGGGSLSPTVTKLVLDHVSDDGSQQRRDQARHRLAALTERELEVAVQVATGDSNGDIAAALFMSEATLKAHVSRLLAKLDCTNRVQVAILVHDAQLG